MNWTDVFPVLDDAMVDEYEAKASKKERRELADWFAVREVVNRREVGHIVSVSLFWKNIRSHEPEIVIKDRAMFMGVGRRRKLLRFDPWHHYAEPLIKGALWLQANRPDVAFRVYLAADLEFLIPDLVIAGCEVHLMKTSSIRHNPGAMWRFLAFEETDKLVTLVDADRAAAPLADIVRTETTAKAGLGFWRVPVWGELNDAGHLSYRPIVGGQMGCTKPLPTRLLMESLVWQTKRGGISKLAQPPGELPVPIHGTVWPDYGFDEWFLQAALYPRAAFEGLLTFVPVSAKSQLLPLDIEYTMWANPASELVYFGKSPSCKPPAIKPYSKVLKKLMKESVEGRTARTKKKPDPEQPPATLVVARYKEDLSWLTKLDQGVRVVVYNKGPQLDDKSILGRINQLTTLPNVGRESDTYLAHLQHGLTKDDGEWTIFTQGDPFLHSPDFLKLIATRGVEWNPVQPLTASYNTAIQVPPKFICDIEVAEWPNGLRVRTALLSLPTLAGLGNYDHSKFGPDYVKNHGLPAGWNVTGHFLELCGMSELAEKAWRSYVGQFAYGAIFAVRKDHLGKIPGHCLPAMRVLAAGPPVHGFIFERLWLHLFGLPFHITEADKVKSLRSLASSL
jgi:hypothetical protein